MESNNLTDKYSKRINETPEHFIVRICDAKKLGDIKATWPEIAEHINNQLRRCENPLSERSYRRAYERLLQIRNQNIKTNTNEDTPQPENNNQPKYSQDNDIKRMLMRQERYALNRSLREKSAIEDLKEILTREIKSVNQTVPEDYCVNNIKGYAENKESSVIYAMLSDIHYGVCYNNSFGAYDTEIAKNRINTYCDSILKYGAEHRINRCYLSIMGDLISGNIHNTIKIENRENIISQVVGVSELICDFILKLSNKFDVVINFVSGNHGRITEHIGNSVRTENFEELIKHYCKLKLNNSYPKIAICNNSIDETIGSFNIFNKTFICVHGDADANPYYLKDQLVGSKKINPYCILAGHTHTFSVEYKISMIIRNGSVCGSGDDYSVKKRLISCPCQVFMEVNKDGVISINPVVFDRK